MDRFRDDGKQGYLYGQYFFWDDDVIWVELSLSILKIPFWFCCAMTGDLVDVIGIADVNKMNIDVP